MKPDTRIQLWKALAVAASLHVASAAAQTEVPHTFEAGEPALASEVNENFATLEQAVQQLEVDTSTPARQAATAVPLASDLRYLYADFYLRQGNFPNLNVEVGAPRPMDIQNNFVSSVSIIAGGIAATFGNNADPAIQGETLVFNPVLVGDSIYFTCVPSGGLAAYFDQDDCVFIDEAPEPLTSIRRQVASAIPLASEARWLVADYYRQFGNYPNNNATAGAEAPDNITNQYVVSVSIGPSGTVTATFGNHAYGQISGLSFVFTPADNLGSIVWTCDSDQIDALYFHLLGEGCTLPGDPPPQPVTVIRDQVRSGFSTATTLQGLIEAYFIANGAWPQSNSELGVPDGNTLDTHYLDSAIVGAAGTVTLTYGNSAHPMIAGGDVVFTPVYNGISFSWSCSSGPIPPRFLPYECWP